REIAQDNYPSLSSGDQFVSGIIQSMLRIMNHPLRRCRWDLKERKILRSEIMPKDDKLDELVNIVKNISKIYDEAGMSIEIDFDYNDGIILIKYQGANAEQITCIINSNIKTVSGIDTTKFWMPDYSREQTTNKKLLQYLQTNGYSPSNIKYRINDIRK
ncbi:MAG: hypothetical protein AAB332_03320, partial [Planctomycetota bacterium]